MFCSDPPYAAIYTLSLHDALPICVEVFRYPLAARAMASLLLFFTDVDADVPTTSVLTNDLPPIDRCTRTKKESRSEEHTSELQSPVHLVCRLLLEKK